MSGNGLPEMPKLGFGLMRLPYVGEEIDIEQVCSMVDAYLEKASTILILHMYTAEGNLNV